MRFDHLFTKLFCRPVQRPHADSGDALRQIEERGVTRGGFNGCRRPVAGDSVADPARLSAAVF